MARMIGIVPPVMAFLLDKVFWLIALYLLYRLVKGVDRLHNDIRASAESRDAGRQL